jgi:SAM-dependent methyltransferase
MARTIVKILTGIDAPLQGSLKRLKSYRILEASAYGPLHNLLVKLPCYTCFEYFDDVPPGHLVGEILCNDLEQLTFSENSFDLIITQDVMEHVANPVKALLEINRVLKPGGCHIFTVPLHEGRKSLNRAGLPPVYHGDPLRSSGAFVYTDWGDDLGEVMDNFGMQTSRFDWHSFYTPAQITNVDKSYQAYLNMEPLKYYRYNSIVFVSRKISRCIF